MKYHENSFGEPPKGFDPTNHLHWCSIEKNFNYLHNLNVDTSFTMITSWHGNDFHKNDPLQEESTTHKIPLTSLQ